MPSVNDGNIYGVICPTENCPTIGGLVIDELPDGEWEIECVSCGAHFLRTSEALNASEPFPWTDLVGEKRDPETNILVTATETFIGEYNFIIRLIYVEDNQLTRILTGFILTQYDAEKEQETLHGLHMHVDSYEVARVLLHTMGYANDWSETDDQPA